MLLKTLLPRLLAAATVKAFPAPDLDLNEAHGELEIFKRDAILDTRDLELAELHRVNLTEMYKHAHIKRQDGDHINIWVHRSFVEDDEEEEQDLAKRQSVRLGHGANFDSSRDSDRCSSHTRNDMTNQGSPFTGGVNAMFRWGEERNGAFFVPPGGQWQPLVVAGSNSGANAVHRVQAVDASDQFHVGTKDVRNDADWTLDQAIQFNGRWRASSTGRETCSGSRVRYQVVKTDESV